MRTLAISTAVLTAALVMGCKKDDAPPPVAPVGDTTAPTMPEAPASEPETGDDDGSRGNISISDEIKKACGITDTEAFFAYDSANVREEDRAVFKKLADCFTTGPLKGRQMRLVGHADPRGSDEYNMVLGSKRAENVKGAVVNEGLPAGQASTTSRGEIEARGTDEASWAEDRRVDIVLGD